MTLGFITSLLIFLVSSGKSIFDLVINPKLFKKEISENTDKTGGLIKAAKDKRDRGDFATTIVFIIVAFISAINLWSSTMSTTEQDIEGISKRVEKIEKFLFKPDGGKGPAVISFSEVIESIERLEKGVTDLSIQKASKNELDEIIKILAALKPALTELKKLQSNTKTMTAGGS